MSETFLFDLLSRIQMVLLRKLLLCTRHLILLLLSLYFFDDLLEVFALENLARAVWLRMELGNRLVDFCCLGLSVQILLTRQISILKVLFHLLIDLGRIDSFVIVLADWRLPCLLKLNIVYVAKAGLYRL